VFVTKLNAAGTGIVYSTYFGGSFMDRGTAIAVDSSGSAYVTGTTSSTNFITTSGAFRRTTGGGSSDAFVAKISPTGALVYSTYLGGNGTDEGNSIGVDAQGNAYLTGKTTSSTYPTLAAFQATRTGSMDAFVTKLNALGSDLVYSTYLGGDEGENGYGIAVDAVSGNAYVAGDTASSNFPVTAGAFQTTYRGLSDAFVAKFSPTGSRVYATYLGGSGGDTGYGIAADATGNAYLTGKTTSANFPLAQAIDSINNGGDAFVTKLNATGSGLVYSTFLGGSSGDVGRGIAMNASGNAIVTGNTTSTNFPVENALQPAYGGGSFDGFLSMLSASGTTLVYSSYLGGSSADYGNAIAVHPTDGSAYIVGETWSTDLDVWDAFQPVKRSLNDGFIAQFDSLGATVSGRINPEGLVPSASSLTFTLEFRSRTDSQQFTRTVSINGANQSFTLSDIPSDDYNVRVKGFKWLAEVVAVDARDGNVPNVVVRLLAGDADNSNSVDVLDMDAVMQAFDTVPGAPHWNSNADFNCDNSVDVLDLDFLIRNFDTTGAP
jgi:hypothetical protein